MSASSGTTITSGPGQGVDGQHRRRAVAVLAVACVVAVGLLLYLTRQQTFFNDDWQFIVPRRDWTLEAFMAPHNTAQHNCLALTSSTPGAEIAFAALPSGGELALSAPVDTAVELTASTDGVWRPEGTVSLGRTAGHARRVPLPNLGDSVTWRVRLRPAPGVDLNVCLGDPF